MASSDHPRVKRLIASINIKTQERIGQGAKLIVGDRKKDGVMVALVIRFGRQSYRGKCTTLSEARESDLMSWMLEASMITHLQDHHGVKVVMTIERECGDIWVSRIEDWTDDDKLLSGEAALITNNRGFALRKLPVKYMHHSPGETRLMIGARRARK